MDISEFLRESIVEITDGLLKAQRQVGPYGVDIRTGVVSQMSLFEKLKEY